jgi:hypothetical protein
VNKHNCHLLHTDRNFREAQKYIGRDVDLCTSLAAMLRDFIGNRTSGLLFCTSTGGQLLQSNTLQDSLHPILKELEHVKGGFNIFRRFHR